MQLALGGTPGDEDLDTIDLTLIPPPPQDDEDPQSEANRLYEAMAHCSDLHPDPQAEGEEDDDYDDRIIFEGGEEHQPLDGFTGVLRGTADGGLPPPMPGSSGWITADNVHEYFDQDGHWIGDGDEGQAEEELGEGAGRVRDRDELEREAVNGHGSGEDTEAKRPRVD
jgi:nucleotide-sensitive chloride channel 1A